MHNDGEREKVETQRSKEIHICLFGGQASVLLSIIIIILS